MTSRELVHATLEFRNTNGRVPRDLWSLPCATNQHRDKFQQILTDFPMDLIGVPIIPKNSPVTQGNPFEVGDYIDEWGCHFVNLQEGVCGEVKTPLVQDEEWEDMDNVHIPVEWLEFDTDQVNAFCKSTDKFVTSGCCPRPFEQLQFIRTTELLYMDLMDPCTNMKKFMQKMHTFYCDLLEKWAKTDVDSLRFMDDWGSQRSLLINPALWDEMFKPMYKDYIDIAKRHGKKTFMHSDGNVLDLFPRLIELGLDAFNSQIFCMDIEELKKYKGKITFWGEIDRQHLLVNGTEQDIEDAVTQIYENLWDNGGCIAQCEFGVGTNPDNAYTVYKTWNKLRP